MLVDIFTVNLGNLHSVSIKLTNMEEQNERKSKSVFELSEKEEEARLQAATDKVIKDLYAKGLPMVFQDDRCPTEYHFIQEYEDGRTYLVLFDIPSRDYIFVKDLTNA